MGSMLLLVGITAAAMANEIIWLELAAALFVAGGLTAWIRDRKDGGTYVLDSGRLLFKGAKATHSLDLDQIADSTLLDRKAGRDLLIDRLRSMGGTSRAQRRKAERAYLQWCTVDIGVHSWTFGIGRELIDRRPDGSIDLMLIRLKDGQALLLSPLHAQDLVDALNRALHQQEPGRRA